MLCPDLTVRSFLRALQIHVNQHGIASKIFSDLGSNFTSGANIISEYLSDPHITAYLEEKGIKGFNFEHYFKGNSSLGSLIEIIVKFTKRMVFSAIKNTILDYFDFVLLIGKVINSPL